MAAELGLPTSDLEELIVDLSATGSVAFVFGAGAGWLTTHLRGYTTPIFRGPAERRWWHVEQGDRHSNWALDVRLDQVEAVRFVREPNPFPTFPGEESLTVRFESGNQPVLFCYLKDLYDGEQLRPERLQAWEQLRTGYGDRAVMGSVRPIRSDGLSPASGGGKRDGRPGRAQSRLGNLVWAVLAVQEAGHPTQPFP